MGSREQILAALRANRAPFESVPPRPAKFLPVTQVSGDLVERFTAELERLTGKVYRVAGPAAAIEQVQALIGEDKSVLTWADLPIPTLVDSLKGHQIATIVPDTTERFEMLRKLEPIRVGITGVEAGLAATGTLVLTSNAAQARLVSLLPIMHIALLPVDKLYPTMEAWLGATGKNEIANSSSVTFITGPSRTSDIEMQTILGVHGPREIHVIIYDSIEVTT